LELDLDGDGILDKKEILHAVTHLTTQTKTNTNFKKLVWLLCGFSIFLVASLFGSSLTAARLTKDTVIDPIS